MKTLVIIPAYNEAESIENVVETLVRQYPQFDYVIVNDGSNDETAKICYINGYNLIDLPANLGLAGAFQTGLRYAYDNDYDYALQFDGDGQHKPEYIQPMVDHMEQGYDIVIGSRFVTQKKPFNLRMMGSFFIALAIKITTGKTLKDPTSGMRLFNRQMTAEFAKSLNYGPEPDTISYLIKCGARVSEVQVEMDERQAGESYLNFSRSIVYMIRMSLSILLIQWFRKREKKEVKKI